MKRLVLALSLLGVSPLTSCWAQVAAPNEAGVAVGQWHTIVRDLDAAKRFWTLMGGTAIKVDGMDVMKFPGVLVFMTQGSPAGGTEGSALNHLGFYVPSVRDLSAKLKAGGVKLDFVEGKDVVTGNDICWVYSPDDVKIELHGSKALPEDLRASLHVERPLTVPIVAAHIHFAAVPSSMTDMQSWYLKNFGGVGEKTINGVRIGGIAGGSLSVGKSPQATLPTKGRAADYIGFEVRNLEAFSKKLQANGVKFDEPYSKTRHKSFASAKLTDPFGVSIELTEGLNRF